MTIPKPRFPLSVVPLSFQERMLLPIATPEQISYAAGLIDGEGCISMSRVCHDNRPNPSYSIRLKVNMTDPGPPRFMCRVFGGKLREVKPRQEKHKLQYQWDASSRLEILKCLMAVQEKLLVKRNQADLVILYFTSVESNERDPELREAFYLKMKELNK